MPAPNAEPETEQLPDYHELTSTRQAEHARNEQYRKDTIQLRTPRSKPYLALIIICYAAFSLSSWVIACIIGRGSLWKNDDPYILQPWRDPAKSSQLMRAAKILAAIAGVLTLPTVASVYSYAAVSFTQYRANGQKLSIRQTLALANQDWMSPLMPLFFLIPTQNRRLGSRFFWFGCFLTILGFAIWPVQQGFLEPLSTIKVRSPRSEREGAGAYDIPQLFSYRGYNNMGVVRLRKAMDSLSRTDCNPHLWHGTWNDNWCAGSQTDAKFYIQPSFSDFFRDDEWNGQWNNGTVFMAQMPSGFNTGFERAWIPRFNTSVDYEQIGQSSAPSGCFTNDSDVDLIKHGYDWEESDWGEASQHWSPHYWSVRTCISSEALHSPLKNETRDRQDFEEVFYLNISGKTGSLYFTPGTWKISARTSVGYFELPNYHNDGTPGPLLEKFTLPEDTYFDDYMYPEPDGSDWDKSNSDILALEDVPNKGPLTTIYTALFSNNSFLDAWTDPAYRTHVSNAVSSRYIDLCEDVLPMGPVIEAFRETYNSWTTNVCMDMDADNVEMIGAIWLANFGDADIMRAALRMAAFMANEINFLQPAPYYLRPGYNIRIDMGVDVTAPVMPLAGIIVGSILLGLFLLLLIALALFAASTPHWTDRLDAYATLKMGAAMALSTDGLARVGSSAENALDRAPGFVGDAMPESEVGRLAVGAEGPLRRRRYEASVCGMIPE